MSTYSEEGKHISIKSESSKYEGIFKMMKEINRDLMKSGDLNIKNAKESDVKNSFDLLRKVAIDSVYLSNSSLSSNFMNVLNESNKNSTVSEDDRDAFNLAYLSDVDKALEELVKDALNLGCQNCLDHFADEVVGYESDFELVRQTIIKEGSESILLEIKKQIDKQILSSIELKKEVNEFKNTPISKEDVMNDIVGKMNETVELVKLIKIVRS